MQSDIIKVLEDCSEDSEVSATDDLSNLVTVTESSNVIQAHVCSGESNDQSNIKNLPEFSDEQPEMTDVLNFVLVDWPLPIEEMIQIRSNRRLLMDYAVDSLDAVLRALDGTDVTQFRPRLRQCGLARAQIYFNDTSLHSSLLYRGVSMASYLCSI